MPRALNISIGSTGGGGGGELDLPLVPWEGGPDFYTVAQTGPQMTLAEAAGWSDPSFFPISVWLADPSYAPDLLDIGINTMIAVNLNPPLSVATSTGMFVVPQYADDEWTPALVGSDPLAVGWLAKDEPDLFMDYGDYQTRCAEVRGLDDDRFMFTNFCHGTRRSVWYDGTTSGTYGPGGIYPFVQMHDAVVANDVACVDQYCYSSTVIQGVHGPQSIVDNFNLGVRPRAGPDDDDVDGTSYMWPGPYQDPVPVRQASAYGWLARALQSFCWDKNDYRPCWVTVETQLPFLTETGRTIILYAEMKGAIWSALVNEARGIMYFQHNGFYDSPPANEPFVGNAAGMDPNTGLPPNENVPSLISGDAALRAYVAAVNVQITALAPVLNTQSYEWDFEATGIETMLKSYDGYAYIFATKSVMGTVGSKTFTLPPDVTGSSVEVIDGVGGPLAVSGGEFSYSWTNEYDVLIGRVVI